MQRSPSGLYLPEFRVPRRGYGMPMGGGQVATRNVYAPNGYDSWGVHFGHGGSIVANTTSSNSQDVVKAGYNVNATTANINSAPSIAGRPRVYQLITGGVATNVALAYATASPSNQLRGTSIGTLTARYPNTTFDTYAFDVTLHLPASAGTFANQDAFCGFTDQSFTTDPLTAGSNFVGVAGGSTVGAGTFQALERAAGVNTTTTTAVAVAQDTSYRFRGRWKATGFWVSINGAAEVAVTTGLVATNLRMWLVVGVVTREAFTKAVNLESIFDYFDVT